MQNILMSTRKQFQETRRALAAWFKNLFHNIFYHWCRLPFVTCMLGSGYHYFFRESLLSEELWEEVAPYILNDVLLNARQRDTAV